MRSSFQKPPKMEFVLFQGGGEGTERKSKSGRGKEEAANKWERGGTFSENILSRAEWHRSLFGDLALSADDFCPQGERR